MRVYIYKYKASGGGISGRTGGGRHRRWDKPGGIIVFSERYRRTANFQLDACNTQKCNRSVEASKVGGILNANLMAIRLPRIAAVIMFAGKRKRNTRLF